MISLSQRLNSSKKESVIRKWGANEEFDKSDVVLTEDGIYHLICQIAGKTGFAKPNLLGLKNNDLINDGTVTWKVQLVQVEDKKLTYQIVNGLEEIKRPKGNVLYIVNDKATIKNLGQDIFVKMKFNSLTEMEMAYEQYGQLPEEKLKYGDSNKYIGTLISSYDSYVYSGVVYTLVVTNNKDYNYYRDMQLDATRYEGAWGVIKPIEEALRQSLNLDYSEGFNYFGMTDKDISVDKYGNITINDGYVIYFKCSSYGKYFPKEYVDLTINPIKQIKFLDMSKAEDDYKKGIEVPIEEVGFTFEVMRINDAVGDNNAMNKIYMYVDGEFINIKNEENTATVVAEKIKKIISNNLLDY